MQGVGDGDEVRLGEGPAAPRKQARHGARVQQELRARNRARVGAESAQLLEAALGKVSDYFRVPSVFRGAARP
jgi:hypothetical protein